MALVQSKSARLARITELLESVSVGSQSELADLLTADGYSVTQATLSRDLLELGAVKVRRGRDLVYAIPPEDAVQSGAATRADADVKARRLVGELVVSIACSGNMVVLRTPPGAANYLAAAVDRALVAGDGSAIGTVAGDDTVFVVASEKVGGEALSRRFTVWASGESGESMATGDSGGAGDTAPSRDTAPPRDTAPSGDAGRAVSASEV